MNKRKNEKNKKNRGFCRAKGCDNKKKGREKSKMTIEETVGKKIVKQKKE